MRIKTPTYLPPSVIPSQHPHRSPLTDTRSVFWTPVPLISPPATPAPCRADCWRYRCSSPRQLPPSRLPTLGHLRRLPERPGARWSPPLPDWFGFWLGGPCWSVLVVSPRAGPPFPEACEWTQKPVSWRGNENVWEAEKRSVGPLWFLTTNALMDRSQVRQHAQPPGQQTKLHSRATDKLEAGTSSYERHPGGRASLPSK